MYQQLTNGMKAKSKRLHNIYYYSGSHCVAKVGQLPTVSCMAKWAGQDECQTRVPDSCPSPGTRDQSQKRRSAIAYQCFHIYVGLYYGLLLTKPPIPYDPISCLLAVFARLAQCLNRFSVGAFSMIVKSLRTFVSSFTRDSRAGLGAGAAGQLSLIDLIGRSGYCEILFHFITFQKFSLRVSILSTSIESAKLILVDLAIRQ